MLCITEVSREAMALRKAMKPSEIISAYSIDLQTSATAAFPTIDKAREMKSPMLGVMSEAFPETIDPRSGETVKDMAVAWMESQLLAVSMFCGAREKMNEWQSKSLCTQIINEHPQLTLMEFILFCSRLRSAPCCHSWLAGYVSQRPKGRYMETPGRRREATEGA